MANTLAERRRKEAIQGAINSLERAEEGDLIYFYERDRDDPPERYGLVGFKTHNPTALYLARLPRARLREYQETWKQESARNPNGAWRRTADRLGLFYGSEALENPDRVLTVADAQTYEVRFVTSAKSGREARARAKATREKKARRMVTGSAVARKRGEIDAATLLRRLQEMPANYTFAVKAVTSSGQEHDVKIKVGRGAYAAERIVAVEGTPGAWYASSLLDEGHVPSSLWIDAGQGWSWTNPREVFAAFLLGPSGKFAGRKKIGKSHTAKKKTESKMEKATYLSFEEPGEFNRAVVRLLGELDAPKTTTIDASSLQIRIPMAKTTAAVKNLVKGLRSGADRAKFRVHNPHPPRDYDASGPGSGKLGEKLKRYREKKNMSRAELAKVMLIEASTLGQIERGSIKCPPYARLDRAADTLGVKTSTLTRAAVCDYRTAKARKASTKKKPANRATPVAKDRCARKGPLTSKARDKLPPKAFGIPELRAYPMYKMGGDGKLVPSASHASNAKARAKQALDRGNLDRKDYQRVIRKANKVLAQCSPSVRRAQQKARKSGAAKARRLCPSDQRKILNSIVNAMAK